MLRLGLVLGIVGALECGMSKFKLPAGRPLPLGEEVLMEKDVMHVVGDTGITVVNRGRGMTMENGGGHEVFATLDIVAPSASGGGGGEKASLDLHGWDPQSFAGHEFALTGTGEKHGGTDVKVRVTKK